MGDIDIEQHSEIQNSIEVSWIKPQNSFFQFDIQTFYAMLLIVEAIFGNAKLKIAKIIIKVVKI